MMEILYKGISKKREQKEKKQILKRRMITTRNKTWEIKNSEVIRNAYRTIIEMEKRE